MIFRDGTDAARILESAGDKVALLRHDTCGAFNLDPALAFAEWESARGVRSVYFIWHELPGFGGERFNADVRELRARGHGIGLHYSALAAWMREGTAPADTIRRALDVLRKSGDVTMAAAHGSPLTYQQSAYEYEVWTHYDPTKNVGGNAAKWRVPRVDAASLALIEVYLDAEYNVSLSDSRGIWTGWRDRALKPFERLPDAENRGLGVLESLKEGDRIMCLLHPTYYRSAT